MDDRRVPVCALKELCFKVKLRPLSVCKRDCNRSAHWTGVLGLGPELLTIEFFFSNVLLLFSNTPNFSPNPL